jgi:hypothetical protein
MIPSGRRPVRSAVIFLVVLLGPLSLPGAASAAVLSLYSAFDYRHPGNSGYARPKPDVSQPHPVASNGLMGCGRGRVRDPATHQCRGPADLR